MATFDLELPNQPSKLASIKQSVKRFVPKINLRIESRTDGRVEVSLLDHYHDWILGKGRIYYQNNLPYDLTYPIRWVREKFFS